MWGSHGHERRGSEQGREMLMNGPGEGGGVSQVVSVGWIGLCQFEDVAG